MVIENLLLFILILLQKEVINLNNHGLHKSLQQVLHRLDSWIHE